MVDFGGVWVFLYILGGFYGTFLGEVVIVHFGVFYGTFWGGGYGRIRGGVMGTIQGVSNTHLGFAVHFVWFLSDVF